MNTEDIQRQMQNLNLGSRKKRFEEAKKRLKNFKVGSFNLTTP